MSQIFSPSAGGGGGTPEIPPEVPEQFTTDVLGPAVAANHILGVVGGTTTANDVDGIRTSGSGSTLTIQLTNRITGTATTTDGVTPVTAYTFPLGATPGTYLFNIRIVAYNDTDDTSAGYVTFATYKTNGAAATFLDSGNDFTSEEGTMSGLNLQTSAVGNTIQLNIVGLAGKTIRYVALTEYIFAS